MSQVSFEKFLGSYGGRLAQFLLLQLSVAEKKNCNTLKGVHLKLKGVLLDVDGTLIDSNLAHAKAWKAAYQSEGVSISLKKILRLIGMGRDHLMPALGAIELNSEQGRRLAEKRDEIFRSKYLPDLKAFPYAYEMVHLFHKVGLKIGLATSAKSIELDKFLEILKIKNFLNGIICSDDVKQSKPSPDIIIAGCKMLGLYADEILMVGDTPYDIKAALDAGVKTIAVRCGGWKDDELEGAFQIFQDPADIFQNFQNTPFFIDRDQAREMDQKYSLQKYRS